MESSRQTSQELIYPPISVVRQVAFIQAISILVSIILGNSFSQWFYLLGILMGLSLLIKSLTDECLLHKIIAKLPWNKTVIRKS